MSPVAPATPDRWSLESWFTAFGAPDYVQCKAELVREVDALGKRAASLGDDASTIVQVINDVEALGEKLMHLGSYLGCLSADDANDEAVKSDKAWMATLEAEWEKLMASLKSALASVGEATFVQVLTDKSIAGGEHAVTRLREEGRHQMKAELEALASGFECGWTSRLGTTLRHADRPDGVSHDVP